MRAEWDGSGEVRTGGWGGLSWVLREGPARGKWGGLCGRGVGARYACMGSYQFQKCLGVSNQLFGIDGIDAFNYFCYCLVHVLLIIVIGSLCFFGCSHVAIMFC